jgi:hypothetical protein
VLWITHENMKSGFLSRPTEGRNSTHVSTGGPGPLGTKISVEYILIDPVLLDMFREFLCRELSVEHLNFVEAVNSFKQKYGIDSVEWLSYVSDCQKIYNDFCDPDCVAPVNISFSCKEETRIKVEKLSTQLSPAIQDVNFFDRPFKEVMCLLSQDSLMRFRRDAKFQEHQKNLIIVSKFSEDASGAPVFQI